MSEIILWELKEIHNLDHKSLISGDFIPAVVVVGQVNFLQEDI